ncbi:hypothetical protein C1H76_3666 [Elsinoe australis]|uniref:Uncharacterized protein n=1 Tax=Elsinoe australis TaxID=40998 RepID=A0A4U7AZA9_9PEZI|nr:hypothetical protein C1H76_3666 [Elsinoe australis]
MISRSLTLLSTPFIILLSIPLTIFALITTSLAFTTLLLRISVVYLELLLALLQSFLSPTPPSKPTFPATIPTSHPIGPLSHHARRRTSSASSTSLSLQTPSTHPNGVNNPSYPSSVPAIPNTARLPRPPSLASLLGTTTPRDYESVGGWRLTSADSDEEALWTGINSRLELPALTVPSPSTLTRNHHRSLTGGSRRGSNGAVAAGQGTGTGTGSPEMKGRSPGWNRRRGRGSRAGSGTGSPEEYFSIGTGQGLGQGVKGLGMTEMGAEEGSARREVASRGHSRRSSVSLVKVRGEGER